MCKCCVLYCSQRRNVYTLREAEHVQARTVEITLARLEHHNRNGSRDDCTVNSLQDNGVVLTPGTAQLRVDWRCGNIANIIVDPDVSVFEPVHPQRLSLQPATRGRYSTSP